MISDSFASTISDDTLCSLVLSLDATKTQDEEILYRAAIERRLSELIVVI